MGSALACQCAAGDNDKLEADAAIVEPLKIVPPLGDPTDDMYWTSGDFDFSTSTEESYSVRQFTGPNRSIRPLLDYTYHCKYSDERAALQDRIIAEFSAGADKQDDLLLPWVVFTAGAMGAGKGFVVEWMEKKKCLPRKQFVTVDPDAVRQRLPEWAGFVAKDPLKAAVLTQKEAGHIAEILGFSALKQRRNIIFDGSLRDVEWYKVYFQKLRHSFPGIRLMILHIEAEREAVLKRAEERGQQTGRMVPKELLESSMKAVPMSVKILAPYVDVAIKVMNWDGKEPEFLHEPTALNPPATFPITCDYISQLWKSVDVDGDGELSKEEVSAAVAQGTISKEVLNTVDTNHDGAISKEEIRAASAAAEKSGTLHLKSTSSQPAIA